MKKTIKIISALMLILLIILTFVSRSVYNMSLPQVTAYEIDRTLVPITLEATGTLWYPNETVIKAGNGWRISQVFVKDGDLVSRGDILLTLDTYDHDIQAAAQELEVLRLKNALATHIEASGASFRQLENQEDNENRKLLKLELEIAELEAEIAELEAEMDAIVDGSYSSLKISEYDKNIKAAEDALHTAQLLFDAGGISRSELDRIENNLGNIKSQYEQYIGTETAGKREHVKSKRNQIASLLDAIFTIEQERELLNKEQDERNWSRRLEELSAQLLLLQKQLERSRQYPTTGKVCAEADGVVAGLAIEQGDILPEGAVLMSLLPLAAPQLKFRLTPKEGEAFGTDAVINAKIGTVLSGENGEVTFSLKTVTGRLYTSILNGGQWECTAVLDNFEGQPVAGQDVPLQVVQNGKVQDCVIPIECLFDGKNDSKVVYIIDSRNGLFGMESYISERSVDVLYDNGRYAALDMRSELYKGLQLAGDLSEELSDNAVVWVRPN